MADRPKGHGLTAEIKDKLEAKYDLNLAKQAMCWIEAVLGERLFAGDYSSEAVHEKLKDGVVLCKLINKIQPGCVPKINSSKMAFKMMENIGNYIEACFTYGLHKADMFQTVDLYEKQNMPQVIDAVHALGRKAGKKGFRGPSLGPKEASENKREFTEQQRRAGDGVIGLQAGYNKGASQSGQNFGKTRAIID
eukprot:gene5249-5913_t